MINLLIKIVVVFGAIYCICMVVVKVLEHFVKVLDVITAFLDKFSR